MMQRFVPVVGNAEDVAAAPVDREDRRRGEVDFVPINYVPNRHFIGWLMQEAKVQFGCPELIESNRLMVRRWVRDRMRERGMRVVHQEQWLDKIVAMVFVPSDNDIEAREYLMSSVACARRDRYQGPLYTWWGRMVPGPFRSD